MWDAAVELAAALERVLASFAETVAGAELGWLVLGVVLHLANQGAISWYELARRVARDAEIDATALVRRQADKKAITALSTERGILLPSLESATDRCLRESEFIRRAIGSAGGLRA